MSVLTHQTDSPVEDAERAQEMSCDEHDVLLAQQGDELAWANLFRRYNNLVCSIVGRRGDGIDKDSVAQQVFQLAFTYLATLQDGRSFRSWIAQIASRQCTDEHRRNGRQVPIVFRLDTHQEDEYPPFVSDAMSTDVEDAPLAEVEHMEKIRIVREAITRLHEPFRTLVQQFYFEEMTMVEIAAIHEYPLNTVKTRLFRAREHLRKILAGIH